MIALLLCGLIAGACAAPQFSFSFGKPERRQQLFSDFHIKSRPPADGYLWADLNSLEASLLDFTQHFPSSVSQEGVDGNEYKIIIYLPEIEEKDIVVKARAGMLMVQATHKYLDGSQTSYLEMRSLPDSVNVTGNWIFDNGILKITFPLKDGADVKPMELIPTTTEQPSQQDTTVLPYFKGSREEIEPSANEGTQDVDIEVLGRRHQNKENEIDNNEIPNRNTVEATTYAVDLKDEYEFVPVRY